jgi:hypothetical protein
VTRGLVQRPQNKVAQNGRAKGLQQDRWVSLALTPGAKKAIPKLAASFSLKGLPAKMVY